MEMASQEAYYCQRFLKYVKEHEVAAAVERYYLSRKTVRKWKSGTTGHWQAWKAGHVRPVIFRGSKRRLNSNWFRETREWTCQAMNRRAAMALSEAVAVLSERRGR